jgi:hypothetical protein
MCLLGTRQCIHKGEKIQLLPSVIVWEKKPEKTQIRAGHYFYLEEVHKLVDSEEINLELNHKGQACESRSRKWNLQQAQG